ncbi:MAG: hypothetical protein ACI9LO_003612 [Planctomycetota bacterium]|jgi:hypothetical protein
MNKKQEDQSETSQLLSVLHQTIDQSSLLRQIVSCNERLHNIEKVTGPSLRTESLRREILHMENLLKFSRDPSLGDLTPA